MRWCSFLLSFFLLVPCSSAERAMVDAQLEKQVIPLRRLRNVDPEVSQESEWRNVIADLLTFARAHKGESTAAHALYEISIAYEQLARHYHREDDVRRSLAALDDIEVYSPNAEIADDALVRKAKILIERGEQDRAQDVLRTVLFEYSRGDQRIYAQALLRTQTELVQINPSTSENTEEEALLEQTIILDPGHGGEDTGGVGRGGLLEKDVTLDIALRMQELLKAKGMKALLTREDDTFVPLATRVDRANELRGALLVSLHTNASEKGDQSGIEIYYLDATSHKISQALIDRENKTMPTSLERGSDLSSIVKDKSIHAQRANSARLAEYLGEKFSAFIGQDHQEDLILRGVKKAPFYILAGAKMPAVLLELLYIDHPEDRKKLANPQFRQQLAEAIVEGIVSYTMKNQIQESLHARYSPPRQKKR